MRQDRYGFTRLELDVETTPPGVALELEVHVDDARGRSTVFWMLGDDGRVLQMARGAAA